MRKPIHITIDPQIDTDPAKTYLIQVEGDKDQIFNLLDHAEECGCDSYEIVKWPDGVTISQSEPDLAAVPVDPDANCLNLYAVWTIAPNTSETEKVYIMALTEEGAACLYHQARAREHGNMLCEIMVSKIADAEVCDG